MGEFSASFSHDDMLTSPRRLHGRIYATTQWRVVYSEVHTYISLLYLNLADSP